MQSRQYIRRITVRRALTIEMNGVASWGLDRRQARVGRPRGSTGHQAERLRYQIASLVVAGQRNVQIGRALGVCSKTIRMWLQHPAVRAAIEELEAEVHRVTQRRMAALFPLSVKAMKELLRHDDARVVLRAVEMVWVALGRLPAKGAHVTLCSRNDVTIDNPRRAQPGSVYSGQQLGREDYQEAMRMLRAERERQEG